MTSVSAHWSLALASLLSVLVVGCNGSQTDSNPAGGAGGSDAAIGGWGGGGGSGGVGAGGSDGGKASPTRYFGYAFGGSQIEQAADHSNIVLVSSDYEEQQDLPLLERAKKLGLAVVLDLTSVWFPNGRCTDLDPASDATVDARWADYAERIAPYQDQIALFYPLDEPYWNCAPPNGPLTTQEVTEGLARINQQLKSRFPATAIGVVFAYPSVNDSLVIPDGYDWIGFDCYDGFDSCGDPAIGGGHSIPEFLSVLRGKLTAAQRLMLIPPAFLMAGQSEQDVIDIVDPFIEIAKADPLVVATLGFLWPDLGTWPGAHSLPLVVERYREAGAELIDHGGVGDPAPPSDHGPIVYFHDGSGSAQQIFDIDAEQVIGQIEGASASTYWCITKDDEGDCREIVSGETSPAAPWGLVTSTAPAWERDPSTGRFTLILTPSMLAGLDAGSYVFHVFDAEANERSTPLVVRLARAPIITLSTTLDGPSQSVFHRSVDPMYFRVHFPPWHGVAVCAAPQGDSGCDTFPGTAWSSLPGPGGAWTFDAASGDWHGEIGPGGLATTAVGTYVFQAIDSASGLRGTASAQLVD